MANPVFVDWTTFISFPPSFAWRVVEIPCPDTRHRMKKPLHSESRPDFSLKALLRKQGDFVHS